MPYKSQEAAQRWRDAHRNETARYNQAYRHKHKKQLALRKADYVRKNYAAVCARHKRYASQPHRKERARDLMFQRTYGISLQEAERLFRIQKGRCQVCAKALSLKQNKPNSYHVDHCHTTQQVRGLLCNKCNRGLGLLNDDPKLCERAVGYLQGETV